MVEFQEKKINEQIKVYQQNNYSTPFSSTTVVEEMIAQPKGRISTIDQHDFFFSCGQQGHLSN